MKSMFSIGKLAMLSAAMILGMASCDDAEYGVENNKIYITDALSNQSTKITIDDQGGTAQFSVSLSDLSESDVSVGLTTDANLLASYNSTHNTNYKILPSEFFSFDKESVVIEAGNVTSDVVSVAIKPLSKELSESGDQFAIPVSVVSQTDGFSTVPSVSSYLLILDQVIVTSVPVFDYSNVTRPVSAMRQSYLLSEWSLEFRINMSSFDINNQAIIGMYPSEIYVRFGDAGKDYNMLQIKTQGSQIDSNTRFEPNKWYHIAIVGDPSSVKLYVNGALDQTLSLSGSASWEISGKKEDITLIGSGATYFKADCMLSEFRFWTKAISLSQIQNNMYIINPSTEGLEAYWKMNEGSGNTFEDATGHGNDLEAEGTLRWQDGIRSDGK